MINHFLPPPVAAHAIMCYDVMQLLSTGSLCRAAPNTCAVYVPCCTAPARFVCVPCCTVPARFVCVCWTLKLLGAYELSTASDVYSFGIIMYEVLTLNIPFAECKGKETVSPWVLFVQGFGFFLLTSRRSLWKDSLCWRLMAACMHC